MMIHIGKTPWTGPGWTEHEAEQATTKAKSITKGGEAWVGNSKQLIANASLL